MTKRETLLQDLYNWTNSPGGYEELCKIVLQHFVDKKHLEKVIKEWIADNYGNSEARDPAYDLKRLAERIEEAIYDTKTTEH